MWVMRSDDFEEDEFYYFVFNILYFSNVIG